MGITRFLRPDLAFRVAHVPFLVLKGISSSARCKSTPDNPHPHPKLESPDTADSSQHTSVANANHSSQKKVQRRWTLDELLKLKEAVAKGMTPAATSTLFPSRTFCSIAKQRGIILDNEGFDHAPFRKYRRWSPDEISLLLKLDADGVQPSRLRAHFPHRSITSIKRGIDRYRLGVQACSNERAPWSHEDNMRFTELVQSTDKHAIAKTLGRSLASIEKRAQKLGVRFTTTINGYTAEEIAVVLQMRRGKASFEQIAEELGRSVDSVRSVHYRNRPLGEHNAGMQKRLATQELERVGTL